MTQWTITICLAAAWLGACTATHSVRTVGKGNAAVEASLGGPIFTNMGAPIPAPNLYVGGRYGIRDDLDLSAHYNITSPFIPGIGLNLILSEHWVPIQPGIGFQAETKDKGFSLATSGSVHLITDFSNGAVAVPETSVAGGFRYKWLNPYIGLSLGLNFFRPYDDRNVAMLSPFVGSDFIVGEKVSLALKVTLYDVVYNMHGSQVEWIHLVNNPGDEKKHGMVGVSLGFSYDFLGAAKKQKHNLGTGGGR